MQESRPRTPMSRRRPSTENSSYEPHRSHDTVLRTSANALPNLNVHLRNRRPRQAVWSKMLSLLFVIGRMCTGHAGESRSSLESMHLASQTSPTLTGATEHFDASNQV